MLVGFTSTAELCWLSIFTATNLEAAYATDNQTSGVALQTLKN